MLEVDRLVAVIKPKSPVLQWLKEQPEPIENLNLETIQRDSTALLIPRFDGPNQAKEYIKQIYLPIFEGELAGWGVAKRHWPKERSYELFQKWFEIEFHSMVFDIAYQDSQASA